MAAMKEKTFWIFNAVALTAMYYVPHFPIIAALVLAACIALCAISFLRSRGEPGNPAYGLLGSFLLFSSVYGLLAYPSVVLNDVLYLFLEGSIWLGCGLWAFWIFRVSWRKREANAKQAATQPDNATAQG